METSDDAVSNLFGGGDDDVPELPSQKAENPKRTAAPLGQLSEEARKKRRFQASSVTRGFAPAQLSQPGLLGLGQR